MIAQSDEQNLPGLVTWVTINGIEALSESPLGAHYELDLADKLTTLARARGTGEEDETIQLPIPGTNVLPDNKHLITNHRHPFAVSGQNYPGLIQEGNCLKVPESPAIPEGLWGRLLPIVRATMGTGTKNSNGWPFSYFSGVAGLPADFPDYCQKLDQIQIVDEDSYPAATRQDSSQEISEHSKGAFVKRFRNRHSAGFNPLALRCTEKCRYAPFKANGELLMKDSALVVS
jgi:hypothetical protein